RHRPAVDSDLHVVAGLADLEHVLVGDSRALEPRHLLNFGGVERTWLRQHGVGGGNGQQTGENEGRSNTHAKHSFYFRIKPIPPHPITPARRSTIPASEHAASTGSMPALNRKMATAAASASSNAQGSTLVITGQSKL